MPPPIGYRRRLVGSAAAVRDRCAVSSSGAGGSSHLALELFKMLTGTDILHVPYKGAAPAITDMIAGQVTMIFTTPVTAQPLVRAGRIKVLAVAGKKRLDIFPDVPTTAEQGLEGFDVNIWFGVSAPAGTPRALVQRLNRDLNSTLTAADVKERLATLGLEPHGGTPEEFGRVIREDIERWTKVVKAASISQ